MDLAAQAVPAIHVGQGSQAQQKEYRKFMGAAENETLLRIFSSKKLPSVIGDNQFAGKLKAKYFERKRHIEVPESKRLAPDIDQIKIDNYSTVSSIIERFKARVHSDRGLAQRVEQVRQIVMRQGQT